MQRLVPTARIGAVAYRDRDDGKIATAPRQSEDFVVKWTDLTFNGKKVQDFLDGIVAEGGGDWEEAVKDGFETAMQQLKWRPDAKKVIILVGSSPPHEQDVPAHPQPGRRSGRRQGGVVSTIDVSKRAARGARAQAAPLALRRGAEGGLAAARLLQAGAGELRRHRARRAAARSIALGQDAGARAPPPRADLRPAMGEGRVARRARHRSNPKEHDHGHQHHAEPRFRGR